MKLTRFLIATFFLLTTSSLPLASGSISAQQIHKALDPLFDSENPQGENGKAHSGYLKIQNGQEKFEPGGQCAIFAEAISNPLQLSQAHHVNLSFLYRIVKAIRLEIGVKQLSSKDQSYGPYTIDISKPSTIKATKYKDIQYEYEILHQGNFYLSFKPYILLEFGPTNHLRAIEFRKQYVRGNLWQTIYRCEFPFIKH